MLEGGRGRGEAEKGEMEAREREGEPGPEVKGEGAASMEREDREAKGGWALPSRGGSAAYRVGGWAGEVEAPQIAPQTAKSR